MCVERGHHTSPSHHSVESHSCVFVNEPSALIGQPSKRMRTLPLEIALPTAERFVTWAMDRITQLQHDQHMFMQTSSSHTHMADVTSSSVIADADVSDADQKTMELLVGI